MILVRRLDRLVLREFLKILVLSLAGLSAIYVLVHMMDHIDIYLDHEAPWLAVARYYLVQTPYNTILTMPMAMLIATVLTIGEFGRHGELTAMKASGISLYRMVAPVLLLALVVSLTILVLGETVVPDLNAFADDLYDEEILDRDTDPENFRGNFVFQDGEGLTYIVRSLLVEDTGGTGDQVEIQRLLDNGTFVRINAPQMLWEEDTGSWVLRNGEIRVFEGERGDERLFRFTLLRAPELDEPPSELLAEKRDPGEMGYLDLREYIAERQRLGADTVEEQVDLQMKISYPFANLIIVLFGVALVGSASHAGRQGASVGFGVALFLTLVFWGFLRIGQGIGYGGGLSPFSAAWLANGVFGSIGLLLLARART